MPRPACAPALALALALAAVAMVGCEFTIPAATYIHQTKLISVQGSVVELGPLNPGRVGVPSEAPIAEPMPHDRFAFEATVIDPDRGQVPASELESVWFQCDPFNCGVSGVDRIGAVYDVRCEDIEDLTMDDPCRLGEGDGRFEFELPELGPLLAGTRVAVYYGVIAWGGRSAEDCWTARRDRDELLERCGFIVRNVKVGPSWWLLAYGDSIGIESPIPIWEIPAAVYVQAANRTPRPVIDVFIDGKVVGVYPEQHEFEAAPGSTITLVPGYDPLEQFSQTFFVARQDSETSRFWFQPGQELIVEFPYTTGAVHAVGGFQFGGTPQDFVVDEFADPGTSQIFLVYSDDRYGEGVARLNFEVGS
ncbi:hypothetical protein ENSA5_50910 [Enhygromyxa salina]|uniref:Uncharacterized protein n=1 Tax=Enhygromyxa salina TaxID=215803 RepID=A0A2S9XGY8_9BACT|nr:hypothetical protein [Enhygromyxa salina]PRP92144.1 hypothetical protein ENSA5_50910 [Enhygromyxa salina]